MVTTCNPTTLTNRPADQKPIHVSTIKELSQYDYRDRKTVRQMFRSAVSIRQTAQGWLVTL